MLQIPGITAGGVRAAVAEQRVRVALLGGHRLESCVDLGGREAASTGGWM